MTDAPARMASLVTRPRILAAEDVELNRELIRLFLEPRGYEIDTARDGFEVVAMVQERTYDLVIMDMQMPGMDGLEATQIIRGLGESYRRLPIVALSANIIPDQIQRCLDSGMDAHLAKPFTSESLHAAVLQWTNPPRQTNEVLEAFTRQAGWPSVRGLLSMLQGQIAAFQACCPNDAMQVRHHAHALRGAAAALGYGDLALVCREVECAADGPALERVLPLANKAAAMTRSIVDGELKRAA